MQPPVPDPLLTCALLRRAMTDVERIRQLRESKAALQTLLQRGQIGDDLWAAANAAEKDLELELHEVAGEANTFRPGWGQIIFAQAQEMVSHERLKETYRSIDKMREQERERTAATKAGAPAPTVRIGRSVPVGRQIQPFALPPPAPPEPHHHDHGHDHPHPHPHPHPPQQPRQIEIAPPAASQPNGFAQAPQPRSEPPASPPQPLHPMQNGAGAGPSNGASIVELSDDDEAEGAPASTSPAKPKKAKVRRRSSRSALIAPVQAAQAEEVAADTCTCIARLLI